jgi:trigger factor
MKVDVADLSPIRKRMSVEVPPEVVERETRDVLRGYARKARIPGFRPGKAPLSVVRAHFGREVDEDVRERVVARCCREAAEQRGLEPLDDPVLDEVRHEPGEPLRFQTTFEILPRFELKDYRGVEVRRPSARLGDGELEAALDQLRQAQQRLVAEEGRAAQTGDVIVADLEATAPGAPPYRRERILLEVGASEHLPAFTQHLLGVRAGAQLEFEVAYPAQHPATHWAGKSVAHRLKVHEVKRRELPELDDEFAKDVGDFTDLTALRVRLGEDLARRKAREAERYVRQSVLDKVLLKHPILLPDVLVEREVRARLEELARGLILQGVDPEALDLDWVELRKRQEEPARKSVHARLLLDAIARAEALEVSLEELDRRIRVDAESAGQSADTLRRELRKGAGLEALKNQMLREKTLDLLTTVANIQNED